MEKKLFHILTLLLFAKLSFSQFTGVLDASAVNERFAINKDYLDVGYDLYDYTNYLLYRDSLKLDPETESKLKDGRLKWNPEMFGLDYCYLYDEQYTWALRVYRTIDLNDPKNEYFIKGSRRIQKYKEKDSSISRDTIFTEELSLLNVIEKELKNGYLTPYHFPYFEYDTSFKNTIKIDAISEITKYIKIKEDWRYDKNSGNLKCYPIGLALLDEYKEEIMWFYYPELRYGLFSQFISYEFPIEYSKSWNNIIENHIYETESIKLEHHRNHQLMNFFDVDYNDHRNEFNSLFQLELINNHIDRFYYDYSGEIEDKLFDGRTISGKLINGLKQGQWKIKFENGNTSLIVNFKNNIPDGDFTQKNEKGQTTIKGYFENGLKSGEWLSYFENGQLMAKRNYQLGMLEGAQQTWFKSGKKHLKYNYKNFKLNGDFERLNADGVMTEQGQFKNDYFIGNWSIALKVPELYINIIQTNPNHNWGFNPSALADGYLNYTVNIEQINDLNFCAINTCLKRISISEIK